MSSHSQGNRNVCFVISSSNQCCSEAPEVLYNLKTSPDFQSTWGWADNNWIQDWVLYSASDSGHGVFGWVLTCERVDASREAEVHAGPYPSRNFRPAAVVNVPILWSIHHSCSSSRLCFLPFMGSSNMLRSWRGLREKGTKCQRNTRKTVKSHRHCHVDRASLFEGGDAKRVYISDWISVPITKGTKVSASAD